MHADLVGASREWKDGKETVGAVCIKAVKAGVGRGAVLVRFTQDDAAVTATDREGDLPVGRSLSAHEGKISLADPMLAHGK